MASLGLPINSRRFAYRRIICCNQAADYAFGFNPPCGLAVMLTKLQRLN
jgi:hypothetical protein